MAVDVLNTQTGGEGLTQQQGDESAESTPIKRAPGRPANLVEKGGEGADAIVPPVGAVGEEPVGEEPLDIPEVPEQTAIDSNEEGRVSFNEERGLYRDEPADGELEDEEEEIPLITPILDEEESEMAGLTEPPAYVFPGDDEGLEEESEEEEPMYVIPEDELSYDPEFDPEAPPVGGEDEDKKKRKEGKITVKTIEEANELHDEGYRPFYNNKTEYAAAKGKLDEFLFSRGEVTMAPPGEIFTYPGRTEQYTIIDGSWYDRADESKGWKKITEAGRVYGLDAHHKVKTTLPKSTYKPPRGGRVINDKGDKIYGYPAPGREKTKYMVSGFDLYRINPGDEEWELVKKERSITSFRDYHKINDGSLLTQKEKDDKYYAQGAHPAPTPLQIDGPLQISERDLRQQREEGRKKPTITRNVVDEAGDILEAQGANFSKPKGDDEFDMWGNPREEKSLNNNPVIDALYARPQRPLYDGGFDLVGYNLAVAEWDKKNGPSLPPMRWGIEEIELSIKELKENKEFQLEDPERYDKELEHKKELLEAAKKDYDVTMQSFKTRHEHMQTEEYKDEVKNSPHYKKARLEETTYGMYDIGGAERMLKNNALITQYQLEITSDRMRNFANADLDQWQRSTGATDSQKEALSTAQDRAKEAIGMKEADDENGATGKYFGLGLTWMEDDIKELYKEITETNYKIDKAYNQGKSMKDKLLEGKKIFLEENKNRYDIDWRQKDVFTSTLLIHDFVEEYVRSGKIIIDDFSGKFSISDKASKEEKAYINENLEKLIAHHKDTKSRIYDNYRKLVLTKRAEIQSLETGLTQLENSIKRGDNALDVSSELLRNRISFTKKKIKKLEEDIKILKREDNTILLNDPLHIAEDVSSSSTSSSRQIFQSLPDNLTPKDKLDLYFERLVEKNRELGREHNVAGEGKYWDGSKWSGLDISGEKLMDFLDWEWTGFALSPEQIEFYKNEATIRKLIPLYLNNDWGIEQESGDFWKSLHIGLISFAYPNTSGAFGYYHETSAVQSNLRVLQEDVGITEKDMATSVTMEKMEERAEVPFFSMESGGSMVGTSFAIMGQITFSGKSVGAVKKTAKNIVRLLDKHKKFKKTVEFMKDIKRIETAYINTMKQTKTGKALYKHIDMGIRFQTAGMLTNSDEELGALQGFFGSAAAGGAAKIFRGLKPSQIIEKLGNIFGLQTDKAVALFVKAGTNMTGVRAAHYRGVGEVPEELAQELVQIYQDNLREIGFFEAVAERFFIGELGITPLVETAIAAYGLGLAMGTAMSSAESDIAEVMSDEEYAVYSEITEQLGKDHDAALSNADIVAERILNNDEVRDELAKEAKKEEKETDAKPEEEGAKPEEEGAKPEEEYEEDASLEEFWKSEMGWDAEKAKDLGKSRRKGKKEEEAKPEEDVKQVEAQTLEEALEAHREGFRPKTEKGIEAEATEESIKNTWVEGRTLAMEKPVDTEGGVSFQDFLSKAKEDKLTLNEAASRAKQEGLFDEAVDFQDALKDAKERGLTMDEFAAEQEAKARSKGTTDSDMSVADYIRSLKLGKDPNALNVTVIPWGGKAVREIVNLALEGAALGTENVVKVIDSIKASKWYKDRKAKDPDWAKGADAELEELRKTIASEGATKPAKRIKPTEAVKSIKERIAQFRSGYIKGMQDGKKLTTEEKKAKQDEINEIQKDLLDYAKKNLPKKAYTQPEVTALMNKVRNARTPKGLERALDAIDTKMKGFQEKVKVETIDKIGKRLADRHMKGPRGKRVSAIHEDSRAKLRELGEELNQEGLLEEKTQEELDGILEQIDGIIAEGKKETKEAKAVKQDVKKSERGTIFEELAKQNKVPTKKLKGQQEIEEHLDSKQAVIVYDGMLFDNKTTFRAHIKAKNEAAAKAREEAQEEGVIEEEISEEVAVEEESAPRETHKTEQKEIKYLKGLEKTGKAHGGSTDYSDKIEQLKTNPIEYWNGEISVNESLLEKGWPSGKKFSSSDTRALKKDIRTAEKNIKRLRVADGMHEIEASKLTDVERRERADPGTYTTGIEQLKTNPIEAWKKAVVFNESLLEKGEGSEKSDSNTRERIKAAKENITRLENAAKAKEVSKTTKEATSEEGVDYETLEVEAHMSRRTAKDAIRTRREKLELYNKTKKDAKEREKMSWRTRIWRGKIAPKAAGILEAGKTLENRIMDIARGSKTLREELKKNIVSATNKAYVDRNNARLKKKDQLKDGMKKIFGERLLTGIPKMWNDLSGVSIYDKSIAHDLTNGQLVKVHMMSKTDPSMIYSVGETYYISKPAAEAAAKKSGGTVEEVTDKYNVQVVKQVGEKAGNIKNSLEKLIEIENAVAGNSKLKAAEELFTSMYEEFRSDENYGPMHLEIFGVKMKDAYYSPLTRSKGKDFIDVETLLNPEHKSASSAISNHLKSKHNNGTEFDFTTDAFSTILNYISSMEHAKHFMPVAEAMRNLMSDATKAQVIEKIGIKQAIELEKHMDRILSQGKSTPLQHTALTRLAQYTVVTTLAAKLGNTGKQLTSSTHYLGAGLDYDVGTLAILAQARKLPGATAQAITQGRISTLSEEDSEVIRRIFGDAFIRERSSGKDIDTETRSLMNDLTSGSARNISRLLTRGAMSPTILGDIGGILTGGIPMTLAIYHENVNNKGMSKEDALNAAIYAFVEVSNHTQQSQRDDIISNAQRDPAYRLFLTYTTSQVAAMSEFTKAVKTLTDTKGEYTSKEKQRAWRKAGYYMVSNSLFQIVAGGNLGMFLMDDDDDERERELKKTAIYNTFWDTVASNLQGFGLPGKTVDWMLNYWRGREAFVNVPVIEKLIEVVEFGAESTKLLTNLVSLQLSGEITPKQMLESLYWYTDEKTEKKLQAATGVENAIDLYGAFKQYFESEEGSKMTWWDAIMNRQMDEEGNIYTTAEEWGDQHFQDHDWMEKGLVAVGILDEKEEDPESFYPTKELEDEARKRVEGADQGKSRQEGLVDEANKRQGGGRSDYTADAPHFERQGWASKEEILTGIKERQYIEDSEEEIENYKQQILEKSSEDDNVEGGTGSQSKPKDIFTEKENERERVRVERFGTDKEFEQSMGKMYKKAFGEEPPAGMSFEDIYDAVVDEMLDEK